MNPLDEKLQALLDDRLGDRRDAGLRSATLDPETRRALGAYKAVYRALREPPASVLPADFAARLADLALGSQSREPAPWQIAAVASGIGIVLCAVSIAAFVPHPIKLIAAFNGPLGPLALALVVMPFADRFLARWFAGR